MAKQKIARSTSAKAELLHGVERESGARQPDGKLRISVHDATHRSRSNRRERERERERLVTERTEAEKVAEC